MMVCVTLKKFQAVQDSMNILSPLFRYVSLIVNVHTHTHTHARTHTHTHTHTHTRTHRTILPFTKS